MPCYGMENRNVYRGGRGVRGRGRGRNSSQNQQETYFVQMLRVLMKRMQIIRRMLIFDIYEDHYSYP